MTNKSVLITGAAGAIGQSIARKFYDMGADVILVDITLDRLDFLDEEKNRTTEKFAVDLSSSSSIDEFCGTALAGREIDVLINSAGILNNHKLMQTTLEDWRQMMSINVEAMLLLSQAIIPGMVERRWGRIINMGSLAGKNGGITAGTAYATSKAAVVGLTRALAREYAPHGITVNAIAPAYVMSTMVSEKFSKDKQDELLSNIPVGKFCDPNEIAHIVAFLADDKTTFMTGEVLDATGGLVIG